MTGDGSVTISRAFIESGSNPNCALTTEQHRILRTFPPRKGWLGRCIGKRLSAAEAQAFLAAKRQPGDTRSARKRRVVAALRQSMDVRREPKLSSFAEDTACPICAGSGAGQTGRTCPLCECAEKFNGKRDIISARDVKRGDPASPPPWI